jgi:DeoR/GlpR family transcriptional regulator of sugar metabolism
MWSQKRLSKILEYLAQQGKVQTHELVALLKVSRETIRRDLLALEETGSLLRVHGGAILPRGEKLPEPTFSERLSTHADAKRFIGRTAAGLIEPGASLFIDAGTTTLAFAYELIQQHSDLRIITNSIEISQILAKVNGFEVLLLGGEIHPDVPATYGELTLSEIDRFVTDYAIISPVGLNLTRGATNYALHEAEVARKMIRCAQNCMILCDATKIGAESRVAICRIEEIDQAVTDHSADPDFQLPNGQIHRAPSRP